MHKKYKDWKQYVNCGSCFTYVNALETKSVETRKKSGLMSISVAVLATDQASGLNAE